MSRTSNGNLTGRAASEDRADFRQFLREVEDPRSSFWQGKANDALVRLQNVVGDEEGKRQVENIVGTYKSICEQIALIADLAEAQALERRLAQFGPRKVTVSAEFAKRWTTDPQHYKDHFGADEVEILK